MYNSAKYNLDIKLEQRTKCQESKIDKKITLLSLPVYYHRIDSIIEKKYTLKLKNCWHICFRSQILNNRLAK